MTEPDLPPPPETLPEASAGAPKPQRRDLVPWFYGLGFLILAGALVYLWQNPTPPAETAASVSARQAVGQRLNDIDSRLSRLEQRPVPDLGPITARVDALGGRIADQTQLGARIDAVSGRIEALSGRQQTGIDAAKQQIDSLAGRIAAVESNAGGLDAVTKRMNRIARLQEASLALASGRPIGDLPNAPEALARYAHTAPPTEAQLRLSFPPAEQAALVAQQPDKKNAPFIERVWDRAQGLVTVRRGDDLVVGNSSATTLNQAQAALDAGDLAGAVAAVETLEGPPAEAMATWLEEAKSLLNVRSALAAMADKA